MLSPGDLRGLLADTLQIEPEQVGSEAELLDYCECTQVGGYAQLLEMPKVVRELHEFVQSEWIDTMTGGVLVPSATAQPHALLRPGEVCFPDLPHGARMTVFRSPVANVGQLKVLVNNLESVGTGDPEAYMQKGVAYLNPQDAKEMVVDFDIDAVALVPDEEYVRARAVLGEGLAEGECFVPTLLEGQAVTLYHSGVVSLTNRVVVLSEDAQRGAGVIYLSQEQLERINPDQRLSYGFYDGLHGFKSLNDEVDYLTQPERRPDPVEKRTKIPRDANHPDVAKLSHQEQEIALSFTCLEAAMVHAADNPTGQVANIGMRLQALKQHLDASDEQGQIAQVKEASRRFKKLLSIEGQESDEWPTFRVPEDLPDGYSFRREIEEIAQAYSPPTKCQLLIAQIQTQNDGELLKVLGRAREQFERVLTWKYDGQQLQFPPSDRAIDLKEQVDWVRKSGMFLTGATEAQKAQQARKAVVPKFVKLLEQIDQLPEEYGKLRKRLTNYQSYADVEKYGSVKIDQKAQDCVPRLRKLLEVVQHRLIDPELQTAVETDKSGRSVNNDVLVFASSIAQYQNVDWIKDKKRDDLYLPKFNARTGERQGEQMPEPGFLTKNEETGFKNCENAITTKLPAVP